jgi:hypothetical protein
MPPVLGDCIFCGLALHYNDPGSPPGDAQVDLAHLYAAQPRPWRDLTLIDSTGFSQCFGAGAQREQSVSVGQFAHHVLPDTPVG